MNFYTLQFGLSGPSQPDLVACLRTLGAKSIQTSQGLCVRSPLTKAELTTALAKRGLFGITIAPLPDPLPTDVRVFTEEEK